MRTPRPALVLLLCCVLIPASLSAQQSTTAAPVSNPQALALIQKAFALMGGTFPSDSMASGTVTIVEGSLTTTGTIRILTRGSNQSSEQILTPDISDTVVYSQGLSQETAGSTSTALPLERAVTSLSPDFPVVVLGAALNNRDSVFQLVGSETVDGVAVQHARFWNSFASTSYLQQLAPLAVYDLWIDATSGLPFKLSYRQHEGGGDAPSAPVEVYYSDYRNVGGILFPYLVKKSFNGTPWATITIENVTLNIGLSDSNFPVR